MNNHLKHIVLSFLLFFATVSLTACGSGSSSTPTSVPNSLTVFYAHSLVFRNSTTLAAGYNGSGQLGTGNLEDHTSPVAVSGGHFFSGQSAGGNHSVAFFKYSTVRSWGDNRFGQLGTGTTTYSSLPVKTVNLSNVIEVAAGSQHTVALRNDGTVWAWGDNTSSQLGVPANTINSSGANISTLGYSTTPVQVMVDGAPLSNIVAIAANGQHSLALDAFGNVWAWGLNLTGELGLEPASTGSLARPRVVGGLPTGISAIAAGGGFNYALTVSGTVWAWGNNSNGQLGFVSLPDSSGKMISFTPVKLTVNNDAVPVVQVSAGLQHGLLRLADGTVWSLGYNIYGQLGNNTKIDSTVAAPFMVRVLDATGLTPFAGATDIRAFGSSSMAKKESGWYVWGDNTFGQLGTGSTGILLLPVKSGF